ncbi:MAG: FAD-dependent oxidoreductase [Thermoleophilia bacterium]|nr:FAD-dependent oxidoreductase [Thermoleophilia bacterium]
MAEYDVIVVGAGMAGMNAAWKAQVAGAKVAVVERDRVGGTCPIKGCIPTKALIRSAEVAHVARRAADFGVHVGSVEVDFAAAVARIRDIAAQGESGSRSWLESLDNLDLIMGEASLSGPTSVVVDGQDLEAPKIILATGAEARAIPIPGLDQTPYLTSDDVVLRITELPPKLLVIGAGPIGLELGQALSRLGSDVTIVEITETLLPELEPEVGETLAEALRGEGIELLLGATIERVGSDGAERTMIVTSGGETAELRGTDILLGVGRGPAVSALNLEAAGVEYTTDGIAVSRQLQTSKEGIFAAGDVVGLPYGAFTHVARRMGQEVVQNAVNGAHHEVDSDAGPRAIFTDPEVATIGMSEREAIEAGLDVSVGKAGFSGGKARAWGEERGFAKVVTEKGTRRILGATIVGYHGADLIHEIAVAMKAAGGLIDPVVDSFHIHPTLGERVADAAAQAAG